MTKRLRKYLSCFIVLAILACAWAVVSQTDPVMIYTRQADDFYRNGRLEQALAEYEKVLKLDPNNPYALYQTRIIREKLGLGLPSDQMSPSGTSPEEKKYPSLPPRDYSRIYPRLGAVYTDPTNGFSIRPPQGWWTDKYNPHFAVKFTDPGYEAFIFIKIIKLEGPVMVDSKFREFVKEKNLQVEGAVKGYHAVFENTILFQGKSAFQVRATYLAGPNIVRLTTYYIPSGNRVFVVTTACTDGLFDVWKPVFAASISSLKISGT